MTSARHDNLALETIEAALFSVNADLSRERWARIGMALKSELGEAGFALFDAWSKTAARSYNAKDCADTWKSVRPDGGVNIGTLIFEAQQAGWAFDDDHPRLDAAEVEKRRAEREAERKATDAKRRRVRGAAAALANVTWNDATPASDAHPYLHGKRVRSHGLRIGKWPLLKDDGTVIRHLPDALLIPILDVANGKVISLQGIILDPDGQPQKRYLKNGRKRGGFHMVGTPPGAGEPLVLCEGYATGATVHELTGWCTVVCFDAPNLPVVAEAMREKVPHAAFLIAADNDQWTKANPGLHYAQRAAHATRGCVLVPQFADVTGQPTDFNDLAAREGDAVAHAQLLNNPATASRATAWAVVDKPAVGMPANENVDYFTPLPDMGGKGRVLPTIENLAEVIRRLGVIVRYNMIAKDTEILNPGERHLADNQRGASLARLESECARFGMPTEKLGGFLLYLSDQNPFNPVVQWIASKPWDGRTRFPDLLATVETRPGYDRAMWELLLRRWLISAVAAAFKPSGFWSKGVLVFQGAQSLGKTAWFRALLPDHLRDLIKVDATIDPNNKDSIISAVSHWLVELGELDGTLRKADIARLKGFISQDVDKFRRPYARVEESFQRRTVFFASVNPEQFLADDTGNVRWWTIPATGLNVEHGIDMQQLWAEAHQWFEAGEKWWLSPAEEARLEAGNSRHEQADPVTELILERYGGATGTAREPMTATQVLLAIGFDKPTKAHLNCAAKVLRGLFGEPRRTGKGAFFDIPTNGPDRPF